MESIKEVYKYSFNYLDYLKLQSLLYKFEILHNSLPVKFPDYSEHLLSRINSLIPLMIEIYRELEKVYPPSSHE